MKGFIIGFIIVMLLMATLIGHFSEDSMEENDIPEVLTDTNDNLEIEEVDVNNEGIDNVDNTMLFMDSIALSTSQVNGLILKRISYTTSYNNKTKCPNWVAWHLTAEHTDGPYSRKGVPYYADDGSVYGIGKVTNETNRGDYFVDLEAKEPRQLLDDWSSEYNMSHGHMCPAGDNKWDKAAMNQTFLLTNMCPQDMKLNNDGWKKLEEKCRKWANQYGDIYIVAGPIFKKPISRTLNGGRLDVPDAFFKVVLCLKGTPKAIGFIYINDSSRQSIKDCVCSVDDIEETTGFDFFSSLPDDVENTIESETSLNKWN